MSNKAEGVHAWLDEYEQSKPRMWVEAPESTKAKLKGLLISKSVTTYNVVVVGGVTVFNVGGTRKRYSDFEALKKTLETRYGVDGMLIPCLPPKRVVGNQNSDFVKSRMVGLSLFVNALSNNPFIMHDTTFERWIMNMEGNGENLHELGGEENNTGRERWMDYLQTLAMPPDAEYTLQRVKAELETAERHLKEVLEAGHALTNGLTSLNRSFTVFSQAMNSFANGESDLVILNDIQPEPNNPTPTLGSKTAQFASESNTSFSPSTEHVDLLFSEIINYQISQVHALKDLLKAREELVNISIQKAQKRLYTLQSLPTDKQEKHRRTSSSDVIYTMPYIIDQSEMEGLQMKLAKEEERSETFTKTLIWHTIPLAARERNDHLNKAMANLAAIMASSSSGVCSAGIKCLSNLHINPHDIISQANEAATRLLIPPIKDISPISYRSSSGTTSSANQEDNNKPALFPQARFPGATNSTKVTSNNTHQSSNNGAARFSRPSGALIKGLWGEEGAVEGGETDSVKV